MAPTVDPVFAKALRRELVAHATAVPRRSRRRAPTAVGLAALGLGGVLAAAHIATADGADAPLAAPVVVNGAGPARAALPPAPAGATYLRFELACYDGARCHSPAGGIDGGPSPVMVERGALPLTAAFDPANAQDLDPLDPEHGFDIDVDPGTRWRLYTVYTDTLDPAQADAGPGGTLVLGIPGLGAPPDLVPITATNGRAGYIDYELLTGTLSGPAPDDTHQPPPPVYADDGITIIGDADVDDPFARGLP